MRSIDPFYPGRFSGRVYSKSFRGHVSARKARILFFLVSLFYLGLAAGQGYGRPGGEPRGKKQAPAGMRYFSENEFLRAADRRVSAAWAHYAWGIFLGLTPEASQDDVMREFLAALKEDPESDFLIRELLNLWDSGNAVAQDKAIQTFLLPLAVAHPEAIGLNLVSANALIRQKKYEQARVICRRLLKRFGWSRPLLIREMIVLELQDGKTRTARDLLRKATATWPGNDLIETVSALFYDYLADHTKKQVFAAYTRRKYRRRAYVSALHVVTSFNGGIRGDDVVRLARILIRGGLTRDALTLLGKVQQRGLDTAGTEQLRALCLEELGQWEEALKVWLALSAQSPFYADFYQRIAWDRIRLGAYADALEAYQNAYRLSLRPDIAGQIVKLAAKLNRPGVVLEYAAHLPETPDILLKKARALYLQGRFAAALDAMLRVQQLAEPEIGEKKKIITAPFFSLLGSIYYAMGDLDHAVEAMKDAVQQAPGRDTRIFLALCQEKQGNNKQAKATLLQVVKENPQHVLALLALAHLARNLQDKEQALAWYRRALAADSAPGIAVEAARYALACGKPHQALDFTREISDPRTLALAGKALVVLGRTQDAIKCLEQALELAGKQKRDDVFDLSFQLLLGGLYLQAGRIEDAADVLAAAVATAPNDLRVQRLQALLWERQGKDERAAEQWRKLIRIQPKALQWHLRLARLSYRMKQLKAALAEYEIAYGLQASEPLALEISSFCVNAGFSRCALEYLKKVHPGAQRSFLRAYALKQLGWYAEAEKALEQAASLREKAGIKKRSFYYYLLRAELQRKQGDEQGTIDTLETAITFFPNQARVKNFLGYYLAEQKRDLDRAKKLILEALVSEPENAAYLDSLAWVCYRRNELAEAKTAIQKAIKQQGTPADGVILDHAGDIFWAAGDAQRAVKFWRQALLHKPEDIEAVQKKLRQAVVKNLNP